MRKKIFISAISAACILSMAGACTPETATRGNFVKNYQLERIKPGKDTRQSVLRTLGSPTTTDPFDNRVWYYLGQKTEKHGMFDPEIIDELAIRLTFNDEGLLDSVEKLENGHMSVPISDNETPSAGHGEPSAVSQFLRNLGRFNRPSSDTE